MKNILLTICFDGADFHGFQFQKNNRSVQEELQKALKRLTGENIVVYGCGRTDSKVHANMFYLNFYTSSTIPPEKFKAALPQHMTNEIYVIESKQVPNGFNARFDAVKKEYIYKILNTKGRLPFYNRYALFYPHKIDIELLNRACQSFIGKKNFAAFMAKGSQITDPVRIIYEAEVTREDDFVIFRVSGNGFLYNMVRIMTGTLLYVNEGKLNLEELDDLIKSKDRTKLGKTLPPQGLYLNKVFY